MSEHLHTTTTLFAEALGYLHPGCTTAWLLLLLPWPYAPDASRCPGCQLGGSSVDTWRRSQATGIHDHLAWTHLHDGRLAPCCEDIRWPPMAISDAEGRGLLAWAISAYPTLEASGGGTKACHAKFTLPFWLVRGQSQAQDFEAR